ncbi:MAG: hypothetical protein FOGNACKC_03448 [Anaerolineae bacterium]|nr:hypothetical protein [Anaerolineae bacterium]
MSEESIILPLLSINRLMNPDYKEKIIRVALKYAKENRRESKPLDNALRHNIRIKGSYRSPTIAPMIVLFDATMMGFYKCNDIVAAVLSLWMKTQPELYQQVSELLQHHGITPNEITPRTQNFDRVTNVLPFVKELKKHLMIYLDSHPEVDRDNFQLMYYCIRGQIFDPDDCDDIVQPILAEINGEKSMTIWESWLTELEELAPDAPEWQKIEDFILAVQGIAQRKTKARLGYEELQIALDNFQAASGDKWAPYFGLEDIHLWEASSLPVSNVEPALEGLTTLNDLIANYAELEAQKPTTAAERRVRHQRLEELEFNLNETYRELHQLFMNSIITEKSSTPPVVSNSEEDVTETDDDAEPEPEPEPEATLNIESTPVSDEADELLVQEENQLIDREEQTEPDELPENLVRQEEEIELLAGTTEVSEEASLAATGAVENIIEADSAGRKIEESPAGPDDKPSRQILLTTIDETELLPPPVVVLDDSSPDDEFLWQLVEKNDIAGAYWFSRALAEQKTEAIIPDWLLAALYGARHLENYPSVVLKDLAEIAYGEHDLKSMPLSHQILGLAAALYPTLTAPESNMVGWVSSIKDSDTLHQYSGLNQLLSEIEDFVSHVGPVYPELVTGALTQEERDKQLENLSKEVHHWLEEAKTRLTSYARATFVWRYLATHKHGTIVEFLQPIIDDEQESVDKVKELTNQWRSRSYVISRIDEVDHELSGRRRSAIEATAREQIIRNVTEACQLAEKWCRHLERERKLQKEGSWLTGKVQSFAHQLEQHLKNVAGDVDQISKRNHELSGCVAAGTQLRQTLNQIRQLFRIPVVGEILPPYGYVLEADNLYTTLSRRLLWFPDCRLADDGQPLPNELIVLPQKFRRQGQVVTATSLAMQWLEQEDYRFIDPLINMVPTIEQKLTLDQEAAERHNLSRRKLENFIIQAQNEVEQNVVDGVIYAEDRAKLQSQIEEVNSVLVVTENFRPHHDRLQNIQSQLSAARQDRLEQQQKIWIDNKRRLSESQLISEDDKNEIVNAIEQAIERQNIRVLDEYLAELRNSLDRGARLDITLYRKSVRRENKLSIYLNELNELLRYMDSPRNSLPQIIDDIRDKKGAFRELKLLRLPEKRYQEITAALESWRQLKSRRQAYMPENQTRHIAELLSYLGFKLLRPGGSGIYIKQRFDDDVTYWQAEMTASGLSPLPQFGSERQETYHIVCIWERPGFEAIGGALRSLNVHNQPLLVLYFGRLGRRHREDLINFSRGEPRHTVAVLDETLLLFLAREYDVRLKAFFECALPFTVANPYRPFAAGTVPPEVFVGRSEEVSALQQMHGPCIIYGGRQLGKSALLKQVYREFHAPERSQYVLLQDIKLLGDPAGQDIDAIWRRLRDGLIELGLIKRTASERPELLQEKIKTFVQDDPQFRLLVLFDEADKFLRADSERNFQVVSQLKEIMDITNRRFKVVFAGLHNVQRYQGIANQPLAHMGKPLPIGPLEPKAAVELIEDRLSPLGLHLQDRSLILTILSYTNYHSGLVQLFCHELVEYLYRQPVQGLPPYNITRNDIEEVYRNPDVRSEIRKRFEWTLDLDKHYKVIALTMIADQLSIRDSYSKVYTEKTLRELAEVGWPAAFKDVKRDQFRGYLDEMKGLGLISASSDFEYRLRSPNLVRLMGTEEEIYDTLQEISNQPPEIEFDIDSHHALVDPAAYVYGPLTFAQERLIKASTSGVTLVFGSPAAGLHHLRTATRNFVPENIGETRAQWASIDLASNTGPALTNWLEKFIDDHKDYEQLILFRDIRGNAADLLEQVESALKICARYQRRKNWWLRIIFSFNVQAGGSWFQIPLQKRNEIENRVDVTMIPLNRWNVTGIQQRLSQHSHEILSSKETAQLVLDATGGWYQLLDQFMEWCTGHTDPQPVAEKFSEFKNNTEIGHAFLKEFVQSFSPVAQPIWQIYKAVAYNPLADRDIPLDVLIDLEWFKDTNLSREQIVNALEYLERLDLVERSGDEFTAEEIAKHILRAELL